MGKVHMGSKQVVNALENPIQASQYQPSIVQGSQLTQSPMGEIQPQYMLQQTQICPIVQEKQVFVAGPTIYKEVEVISKDAEEKLEAITQDIGTLADTLEALASSQNIAKSESQMQYSEFNSLLMKAMNKQVVLETSLVEKLEELSKKLAQVASEKPTVSEIRHVETRKLSKPLIFLNILLLGSVLILLCK